MKKGLAALIVMFIFMGFVMKPEIALADSPLTSTPFSKVYEDIDLVKQAGNSGVITIEMAEYLADESNPIDVKAAIINALSWEVQGRDNAGLYCEYIYNEKLEQLDVSSLSGDQEFCIGYLIAMDDYINVHTSVALTYLKEAEQKVLNSFTIASMRAIVDSMYIFDVAWDGNMLPIIENDNIQMDMRQDAINIILDYMSLYHQKKGIIVSDNSLSIETGKSTRICLFGTWMPTYTIVEESNLVKAEIVQDEYGISYLNHEGLKEGASYIKIMNSQDESVIVTFAVNSEATNYIAPIPHTGDRSMSFVWGIGMVLAVAGIIISFHIGNRHRICNILKISDEMNRKV